MNDKKTKVKKMFDSIAGRYDLLNHLLSLGIDKYWRWKAMKLSGMDSSSVLLDVACGTGDVAISARKFGVRNIFGADFSHNMLVLFNKKSPWIVGRNIQLVAEKMPVKDESVTHITVAFGVRNFYDIQEGFNSFFRVLKKNGKAVILEFRMPSNKLIYNLYKFYFSNVVPFIGGIISGDKEAYTYLPESVKDFDQNVDLPELLYNSGFSKVDKYSLTFGIVQLIIAEK